MNCIFYVKPQKTVTLFLHFSKRNTQGRWNFGVESAELYFLDHFTKIEGTSLTPEITDETEKAIISKGLLAKQL